MLCFSYYVLTVESKEVFEGTKKECLRYFLSNYNTDDFSIDHIHYES